MINRDIQQRIDAAMKRRAMKPAPVALPYGELRKCVRCLGEMEPGLMIRFKYIKKAATKEAHWICIDCLINGNVFGYCAVNPQGDIMQDYCAKTKGLVMRRLCSKFRTQYHDSGFLDNDKLVKKILDEGYSVQRFKMCLVEAA